MRQAQGCGLSWGREKSARSRGGFLQKLRLPKQRWGWGDSSSLSSEFPLFELSTLAGHQDYTSFIDEERSGIAREGSSSGTRGSRGAGLKSGCKGSGGQGVRSGAGGQGRRGWGCSQRWGARGEGCGQGLGELGAGAPSSSFWSTNNLSSLHEYTARKSVFGSSYGLHAHGSVSNFFGKRRWDRR